MRFLNLYMTVMRLKISLRWTGILLRMSSMNGETEKKVVN